MNSADPIGADDSGATDVANCSNTFWQSMGFGKHASGASTASKSVSVEDGAEFAGVDADRRVRLRESPLATGDGRPA